MNGSLGFTLTHSLSVSLSLWCTVVGSRVIIASCSFSLTLGAGTCCKITPESYARGTPSVPNTAHTPEAKKLPRLCISNFPTSPLLTRYMFLHVGLLQTMEAGQGKICGCGPTFHRGPQMLCALTECILF